MIIPYQVDVPMSRWPVANFVLIPVIVLISLAALLGGVGTGVGAMVLDGWNLSGMVGHIFLHGGIIHLVGNMIFLWVFGNAVCAKIGNLSYPFLVIGLGMFAAAIHLLLDGRPAIGASGAVNAVVGFYLVLYPLNNISCVYLFFFRPGQFSVSSIWMILFWLAFDIWGAMSGGGSVAYWGHLGGLAAGAGLAVVLISTGVIQMTRTERSLIDVLRSN